jgi:uncharacterized protein YbjT (DUF2867 family)
VYSKQDQEKEIKMSKLNLVTGANGHLGNNLVRALLENGETVRASVRNTNNRVPFEGLDCEVVQADLMDKDSLLRALEGVDTLYQVAAVFPLPGGGRFQALGTRSAERDYRAEYAGYAQHPGSGGRTGRGAHRLRQLGRHAGSRSKSNG